MNIIYCQNEAWEKDYVTQALSGHTVTFLPGSLQKSPEYRDEHADVLAVFVDSKVGKTELDRFPALRFIAARSTGFDNIDLAETTAQGIVVSNVPNYGENTVAEFTFALLLSLSRKICDSRQRVRERATFAREDLVGFDLRGKILGVVGTGNIGKNVIRIANGFGMHVIAFDAFPSEPAATSLGFRYVSLDELLSTSDIISLHVPLIEATRHLINRENINRIKRGAYLINTARGGIIETNTLISGLKEGIFGGVALDVLEEEASVSDEIELLLQERPDEARLKTTLANRYLIDHPNVIITPHNAFNTKEAIKSIVDTSIANIAAFAAGTPQNIVAKRV